MQKTENEKKKKTNCPVIFPFVLGLVLGFVAKLADSRYMLSNFHIFSDIMGRFGIWGWAAVLIAVFSRRPVFAAVRSFLFFAGMLIAYYSYTVLLLHFTPRSQILLWSGIALFTPACGFAIWYVRDYFDLADKLRGSDQCI